MQNLKLLTLILTIIYLQSFGQKDTIKACGKWNLSSYLNSNNCNIKGKVIFCVENIFSLLNSRRISIVNSIVSCENCDKNNFTVYSYPKTTLKGSFGIAESKIDYVLKFSNINTARKGLIHLYKDTIVGCHLTFSKIDTIYIQNNIFKSKEPGIHNVNRVYIDDSDIRLLEISRNKMSFGNSNDAIAIENSTIGRFQIWGNNSAVILEQDTILHNSGITTTDIIKINDCDFWGNFHSAISDSSSVSFSNCSFHDNTTLRLHSNNVSLINCKNIDKELNLDFFTIGGNVIWLNLSGSNIEKINFDFDPRIRLYFSDTTNDVASNVYEAVIGKFKSQGMHEAVEHFDIQYKKWQYRRQFAGSILNFFDWAWWYYGYNRWLIVLWTIAFLICFYILNLWKWNRMMATYTIIDSWQNIKKKNKWIVAFIFTTYIFFSLKVDFEKLKYHDRGMLASFIAQYATGLLCLFFVFNAILKL